MDSACKLRESYSMFYSNDYCCVHFSFSKIKLGQKKLTSCTQYGLYRFDIKPK